MPSSEFSAILSAPPDFTARLAAVGGGVPEPEPEPTPEELEAPAAARAAEEAEALERDRRVLATFGRFDKTGLSVLTTAAALKVALRSTGVLRSDASGQEAMRTISDRVRGLRRDLEGPAPSAVERLLVDRCLVTWLDLQRAQAELDNGGHLGRRADAAFLAFLDRRLDRAHRRHLSALRSLAAVRRLDLSGVTIAVDARRVEIGRPAAAAPALEGGQPS